MRSTWTTRSTGCTSSELWPSMCRSKSHHLYDSTLTFRPCYIMACYCTVGEQAQGGPGRQGSRLTNRQDSSLSFASISNFGKESILNLASAAGQSAKHSLVDPGHKSFRPETDCQLHYECNDPISRYFQQPSIPLLFRCFALKTLAEDLASQTPEYRWREKILLECI